MNAFREFVEVMAVVDLPVLGNKFSWFSSDGKAMSRLDRFLISEGFLRVVFPANGSVTVTSQI
ncbi:endonuclease/exonuclease/phosphatase family protein, partial [Trifolium medium]|nr:endonuclease/exonuclease/phosphatase family protein [Trifolium medium]